MRDNYSRYTALNAQILGVSVDSPFSLKMWEEKNNLNFPLLSDFNKEVCKAYGAIHDVFAPGKFDYMGVAKRSAFVIDKNVLIKYAEVLDNPGEEPNYEKIKEALQG
jgi:peroxiredoxin